MEQAILTSGHTLERHTYLTVDGRPILNKLLPDSKYFERSQLYEVLMICKITPHQRHRYAVVTPDLYYLMDEDFFEWLEKFEFMEFMIEAREEEILNAKRIGKYRLLDYDDILTQEAATRLNVSYITRDYD